MTATEANPYALIKAYERGEFERLNRYLEALDAAGWVEQSYCTDWLVYQVVSHIGSGSRIGRMRLESWVNGAPPATREVMQGVWGLFDSLRPEQMLSAFAEAAAEYLAAEAGTPDDAGLQEVDGFAGKRPMHAYQLGRVWELACHSWDVHVARNPRARFHPDAVAVLAPRLQYVGAYLDKERGAALSTRPIVFKLTDSGVEYTLDPGAERPRLQPGATADAPLVVEGPDEEIMRFIAGRSFVPGTQPKLRATRGTPQDLANLRRAFR
ncbi:MAG TPA: maleylpyruvate isomerase family mycothiol-dependent enzyme [Chloroflexota bacterium]|nr:maleylpyruvate isomerase family mycothiol-dependent enzyme [Chloroflexota bacterium]